MQIHGMPEQFWIVTKATPDSTLADICFACSFDRLMLQVRGGLDEKDIVGLYADEGEARDDALRLLGIYPVRPQDALIAEILVNVMVVPVAEDLTAEELAKAAVEAVSNAIQQAEAKGFQHCLPGRVTLGTSLLVELRNITTVIG